MQVGPIRTHRRAFTVRAAGLSLGETKAPQNGIQEQARQRPQAARHTHTTLRGCRPGHAAPPPGSVQRREEAVQRVAGGEHDEGQVGRHDDHHGEARHRRQGGPPPSGKKEGVTVASGLCLQVRVFRACMTLRALAGRTKEAGRAIPGAPFGRLQMVTKCWGEVSTLYQLKSPAPGTHWRGGVWGPWSARGRHALRVARVSPGQKLSSTLSQTTGPA